MRVLMTTDAVGGVWQYSLSLARGLMEQGCQLMLVCLGEPSRDDLADLLPAQGLDLVTLPLKLEWMPDAMADVRRGIEEVGELVALWKPDLLHSNQFCFGLLGASVPVVVVAHSDVLSWNRWHRGEQFAAGQPGGPQAPSLDTGLRPYRDLVASGLGGAAAVVSPSRFMAASLEEIYGRTARVIHNGLWPDLYVSHPGDGSAIVAGRLWDEAKGAATAVEAVEGLSLELRLIGPTVGPAGEATYLPASTHARYLGGRSWRETREAMARASIYLATSSYEPFGLAALEAALCGCALIAADTPAYREVWGPAAIYFRPKDAGDLRRRLEPLVRDPETTGRLGAAARARAMERYTADRMAREYLSLYNGLAATGC